MKTFALLLAIFEITALAQTKAAETKNSDDVNGKRLF